MNVVYCAPSCLRADEVDYSTQEIKCGKDCRWRDESDRCPYPNIRFAPSNECDEDVVNHPSHYTSGKIECIDAIESAVACLTGMEALLTGQVIKYVWRWKLKNGVQDLNKADWYLKRLIMLVREQNKLEKTE